MFTFPTTAASRESYLTYAYMAHQRHHKTAEQQRLAGQTLDFLVGSAEAHRERRSMSFAARVFDPDLRGLATEPFLFR